MNLCINIWKDETFHYILIKQFRDITDLLTKNKTIMILFALKLALTISEILLVILF